MDPMEEADAKSSLPLFSQDPSVQPLQPLALAASGALSKLEGEKHQLRVRAHFWSDF